MITSREGLFVLLTNRSLTAPRTLDIYQSRNVASTAFLDLKHGIGWRPAGYTPKDAIKGRVPILFLALFYLSMLRFLYAEFAKKTAGSLVEELTPFSLMVERNIGGLKRCIWSNFSPIIRRLGGRNRLSRCRRRPNRPSSMSFSDEECQVRTRKTPAGTASVSECDGKHQ